jgi:hypothetical protein
MFQYRPLRLLQLATSQASLQMVSNIFVRQHAFPSTNLVVTACSSSIVASRALTLLASFAVGREPFNKKLRTAKD